MATLITLLILWRKRVCIQEKWSEWRGQGRDDAEEDGEVDAEEDGEPAPPRRPDIAAQHADAENFQQKYATAGRDPGRTKKHFAQQLAPV